MQQIAEILIWLPAILIGLTFHEYAHGRVAYILGDDTAYLQGRLTLNPLPHIDWMGFFMLIIAHFGWAKPVQVNPVNFNRNITMKQGMMLVSLAGPAMNLLLALAGMIALRILVPLQDNVWAGYVLALLIPLIQINLILAAFNLIPVPPLDGSKILAGLLPDAGTRLMYSLEQYGPILLLLLIITGVTGKILLPLVTILYNLLFNIVF
ncbi:MAG TPA: site-2 protease family protein [Syntrophomonadaceae bacterium]|nr:site-2 protease family protein [Syntrophomonadaceae bacterium]HRX21586.1 site-2 protease family protein [Syntrophomonadaceae bacterium]